MNTEEELFTKKVRQEMIYHCPSSFEFSAFKTSRKNMESSVQAPLSLSPLRRLYINDYAGEY